MLHHRQVFQTNMIFGGFHAVAECHSIGGRVLMTWKKDCLNITMSRAWTSKPHLHAAAMMINITKLTHVVLVSRQLLYSDILTIWILQKDYFEFSAIDPIRPLALNSKISCTTVWFHCSAIIFLVPKVFNDTSYVFWFLAIAQTLTHIIVVYIKIVRFRIMYASWGPTVLQY